MSAVPLSYSCGSAEPALLGRTIDEILSESAARFPHGEALVVCHQGVRLTYAEFQSKVRRTAKGLLALGIRNGDRVGVWACNCEEWVLTQFATAAIGAILVNINPAYGTRELDYALRQSGTHTLVFHSHFKQSNYPALLEEICPEIAQCKQGHLRARTLPGLRRVVFLGEGKKHDWLLWQELSVLAQSVSDETLTTHQAKLTFEDPINIQYTSGTTGFPKGVVLTHHNLVNNALFIASSMNLSERDRICIPVPFYHCFGMVLGNLTAVLAGATMVIPSATFDAAHALRAVEQERCTALYGVPSMFIAELEHPEFARFHLGTLRTGIMAGSPCPIEVMKKVVERMNCREITIAYGQTESSPVITQTSVDDSIERRVATVGRALPHTEVKIVDPVSGRIVPRGQPGELCARGYLIMKGYYRNRKATSEAIDSDGWLHTGDLAVMNTGGYVNITGRARDMIIRGGENIYPREIEEFLYTHPKISDAQVIGVPDRRFGEEVMVWIRLKEGETTTVEELRAFCKGKIAHYKVPRFFKFVNEYPMTISGKVQKYRMREIAIQELGLQELTTIQTA